MGDSEVVASIVAGDPEGLAQAYDMYADPLYKYCRSMLSDPADAADAVQDTFVIAASRLAGLREPERLRAWLYAVARNECLRILRAKKPTSALDEAPDVTDDAADVGEDTERAELRALLENAADGLNPTEREVVELQLRQGLEPAEVAAVLGVSLNHAHSLLSRARNQLEICLGVLLVGRAGREDCSELSSMLAGWDGRLTALLRKRVHRHIEQCPTCSTRRALELRPAMLLGLSPAVAMGAAAAESFRLAAPVPAGLKAHTLALASGQGPTEIAHRAVVLGRTGSFAKHGFPKPAHHAGAKAGLLHHAGAKAGLGSSSHGPAAVGAGAALAVAIAVVAVVLSGGTEHVKLAGGKPPGGPPPSAAAVATLPPATGKSTPTPHPPRTPPALAPILPPTTAAPTPTPTTAAIVAPTPPTTTAPVAATAAPTPTASAASPTPTSAPGTPTPTPSPTPTPPPTAGMLVVTPPGGPLVIPPGGLSITLTAQGGPVDWSIAVSGVRRHHVRVHPSSGTLADGASVRVMIKVDHTAVGETLTISPGGTVFAIVIGWPLR
jgi:RNA polymerase sigma factor (sigma-70 family)